MAIQIRFQDAVGTFGIEDSVPCLYIKHKANIQIFEQKTKNYLEKLSVENSVNKEIINGIMTDFTELSAEEPADSFMEFYENLIPTLVEKGIKYHATLISQNSDLQAIIKKFARICISNGLITIYFAKTDNAITWLKSIHI